MKISKLINYGQGTTVYKANNKKSLCKGSIFHVIFFWAILRGGGEEEGDPFPCMLTE
jgi:hypothetical protein